MKQSLFALILSFVAGFIDSAGFVRLNGLFTAHVTGNFIVAGAALTMSDPGEVGPRLMMMPIFMLFVGAVSLFDFWSRSTLTHWLWIESALLIAFLVAGCVVLPPGAVANSWAMLFVGGLGTAAMAVQNAMMRLKLGSLTPTTIMTGNTTQFMIEVCRWIFQPDSRSTAVQSITKFGTALLGFFIGAAVAAVLMKSIGFWCVAIPCIVTAYLAFQAPKIEVKA